MSCNLSVLCDFVRGKVNVDTLDEYTYVSTENMLPDKAGITTASSLPTVEQTQAFAPGDILVSNIRPYFKKIWFADMNGGCSNDVLVFRAKEHVYNEFLYYVLADDRFFDYATATSKGTKMPRGDKTAIMKYEVPQVPFEKQKSIASILGMLDRKIQVNRKTSNNLLQQAQAYFAHIFSDDPLSTPATIADVALNVTDGVHNTVYDDPEGEYFLLSCKNIKAGVLKIGSSERRINKETFDKLRSRTHLAKGDVLISSVGTVGEMLLVNTEPSNYEFQRSVAIVKPNPSIVSPFYLYESLIFHRAELINAAHGAVQQCLFISDIAGFPIDIPDPKKLQTFNNIVAPMFDTVSANETENIALAKIRDFLLPKLLSGDIDVSDMPC